MKIGDKVVCKKGVKRDSQWSGELLNFKIGERYTISKIRGHLCYINGVTFSGVPNGINFYLYEFFMTQLEYRISCINKIKENINEDR